MASTLDDARSAMPPGRSTEQRVAERHRASEATGLHLWANLRGVL